MNQKLVGINKQIISRITHFLTKFFFLYIIFFFGNKFVNILWLYIPRTLFSGQKSDAISLLALTLGFRVVMLSYEESEVSATFPLYWLSCSISSKLWAFGITHGVKADFLQGLLSTPPRAPHIFWIFIGMEDC